MKRLVLLSICILGLINFSYAQVKNTASNKKNNAVQSSNITTQQEKDLVVCFTKAKLTENQQKLSRLIIKEAVQQEKLISTNVSISDELKKINIKEIHEVKNDRLKEVMSESQYKIFEAAAKTKQ